eukprot:5300478-Prymnesium_polylepis.1
MAHRYPNRLLLGLGMGAADAHSHKTARSHIPPHARTPAHSPARPDTLTDRDVVSAPLGVAMRETLGPADPASHTHGSECANKM